jgi:16S rRNA (guanine527-N7)-methyltransferase
VAAWSARVNLTGARTPEERAAVLVAPVVPLAPHLLAGRLLDVGSGNGSPGLVLAVLRRDLRVTLVEPRQRRWAFLREAARAVGRPEIEVVRGRLEDFAGEPADNVTVRALSLPARALVSRVARDGVIWSFGGAVRHDDTVEERPGAGGVRAFVPRETSRPAR